ncbi:quinon protein alcohol dehydrogenase-like superfamily [Mycena metata]|uniref:Quinon protein alcohol dehydrogenase-like superfamily n=1 Tax=Mycena metata TaxID=1033252 RepID=A0AAD7P3N7_9AGAR|nr:quinon protein alcohol dehydrogenase-like superfamily [Mycena metata]
MAASNLQPHTIPLPQSPAKVKAPSKKGKGKAKEPAAAAPKRRVQVSQSEPSGPSWDWTSLTDSLVSNVAPIFTKDGSYFFSLVGASVRIYAVTTGKVVSTLSIPRPTGYDASGDILTCAVLNPHNAFQLITGSVLGVLAVWDFLEGSLLQTVDISQTVHHMCVHENFKDTVFVTASRPGRRDEHSVVLRVSLKPAEAASQSSIQKSSEITPIGKVRLPTGLALSPSGAWLVAIAGHKAYVASTASLRSGFTKYVSPERLTCIAFHPSEDYFATGDDKGSIRLWYCLDHLPIKPVGVEKKTQTTTMHWHAHPVLSLAFTANGAYLLSGGEESVLVIWQLHTGKREFLPRIGSPIKTISVSKATSSGEEEYLLGLADATYAFVGAASLKVTRSYSRIKLDPTAVPNAPSTSKHSNAPLSVHSLTSTLILPSSHPASLQIYSPISSTLVSELEVSPSNRVSRREREDKPIEPCRIERVTISHLGDWMATIDIREGDENIHGESYLKIWRWDRKTGYWILNTRVDRPHGLDKVTDVSFSPAPEGQPLLLVTAGGDKNIKTWRKETPSHVSWSPDASLLAVTLPHRVALFTPSTNLLRHSLALSECGAAGRYLAVVGTIDLVLWDLVTQRVRWHHKSSSSIRALVSHPREDTFVVLLSPSTEDRPKSRVTVFSVNSAQPTKTVSVPFDFRNVVWYPLATSSFSLVGITHDWKVVVLGDGIHAHVPKDEGAVSRELASHSAPQRRTLFQDIFGKSAFGEQALAAGGSQSSGTSGREGAEVFEGAAYLMPPLEELFEPLMSGFLKPRAVEGSDLPSTIPVDMDVDMEPDASTTLAGVDARRTVDKKEMGAMVDLFKAHTLKAKAPVIAGGSGSKPNGLVNGKINGVPSRVPSSAHKPNGVPTPSKVVVNKVSESPAQVNGKKRKKSLG